MNVLWITNVPTGRISAARGCKAGVFGGWLDTLADQLSRHDGIHLTVAFPDHDSGTAPDFGQVSDSFDYCAFGSSPLRVKPDSTLVGFFEDLISRIRPDVIHIWGTEYLHSYEAALACRKCGLLANTVVSIQGLVSRYAMAYFAGIERKAIPPSVGDIIRRDSIAKQQATFFARGIYEEETLKMVRHVIGRTDWDRACTRQINPDAEYHFCNETLRAPFYSARWNAGECEPYSIFASQCAYPIKGFHKCLEAFAIVRRDYPAAKLYTTGSTVVAHGLKDRVRQTSYRRYLEKEIERMALADDVCFLGYLDAETMCARYCRSNVFVSASSIENSPNSVGEAMLLGVPVVSSAVGGVSSMLMHGREGYLYPFDEAYMLAYYVEEIFRNRDKALEMSEKARLRASDTFDRDKNFKTMLDIYGGLH